MSKKELENELEQNLKRISENGIVSYEYIHQIIEMINSNGQAYRELLNAVLQEYAAGEIRDKYDENMAFTAYYSLGFYYKRFDKVNDLKQMIDTYQQYFEYAILKDEVSSWYYRRIGDLEMALALDRTMIERIKVYENAGPYISYASSVSKILEKELESSLVGEKSTFWHSKEEKKKEWQIAIKAIEDAMIQYHKIRPNKHYGKHYAIYGRLLMFTPDIENKSLEEINQILDKATHFFNQAIQYENENEEDYYKRYEEYRQCQNKCNLIRLQLGIYINSQLVSEQLEQLKAVEKEMKDDMELRKAQEIELLAMFTAVISVILAGINIVTKMTLVEGEILFIVVVFSCILLVSIYSSMVFERKKYQAYFFVVLSIIVIIVLVLFSYFFISGK